MNILGLDTSSRAASVALWRDGVLLGEILINDKRTHSQKLMPMLEDLLKLADMKIEDIDLLAVCLGPGSFTGIRIAVATVKAIAHVRDLPIVGINSLENIAYSMIDSSTTIIPILDAQSSQVYTGAYEFVGGELNTLKDLCVEDIRDVLAYAKELEDKKKTVTIVGEGIYKYMDKLLSALSDRIRVANPNSNVSRAASLCHCASIKYQEKKDISTCYDLAPIYLRKSQAEVQYEEKQRKLKNDL